MLFDNNISIFLQIDLTHKTEKNNNNNKNATNQVSKMEMLN